MSAEAATTAETPKVQDKAQKEEQPVTEKSEKPQESAAADKEAATGEKRKADDAVAPEADEKKQKTEEGAGTFHVQPG
jgi:hypothetical protein